MSLAEEATRVVFAAVRECCADNPHMREDFLAGDRSAQSWLLGYVRSSLRSASLNVPSDSGLLLAIHAALLEAD